MAKWKEIGDVLISNLPKGFLLIWCSSHKVMQQLLLEGPWSGIILQLSPWQPFFEPSLSKLNTATIWVKFHNLPVDFWDGESLEVITAHIGHLPMVDELTTSLSRSKFACVCIQIDLSKPLSCVFWIGDSQHRVFIVVLYERLPTFCFTCGLIGHGSNACN